MAGAQNLLVVVNESMPKRVLFDAIARYSTTSPAVCTVAVPQTLPRRGMTVAEETVAQAAANRLEATIKELERVGIEASGETLDPDPYLAVTDAVRTYDPDAIIIYAARCVHSGFWRQDLIERVKAATGLPVEHVYADDPKLAPADAILAIATPGFTAAQLAQKLQKRMVGKQGWLAVLCPTLGESTDGRLVKTELEAAIAQLNGAGIDAVGQTMPCDTMASIENAIQYYPAKEIVVVGPEGSRKKTEGLLHRLERFTAVPIERLAI